MESAILAEVIRGETVESVHRGHLIAIDADGAIRASAGNPDTVTFLRSAAKPFQAIACIASGAANRFGFTDDEIAIACGSHSGENVHVATVKRMLEKAGFSEADLRCGTHLPFYEAESKRMQRAGEKPTQLHNNCSGKHAAMLAFAKHVGAHTREYNSMSNPIQRDILNSVAKLAMVPVDDIALGIDGCTVPNFAMPVSAMAQCIANLMAPPDAFETGIKAACRRIVSSMTKYPELVGGTERLDTILMNAAPGKLISKVGAEGVWLCGILPSDQYPKGQSIALKIEDGDDKRARPVVAVEVLKRFGVVLADDLPELSPMPIINRRGYVVGKVVATIESWQ